jgi:hypothetical protein
MVVSTVILHPKIRESSAIFYIVRAKATKRMAAVRRFIELSPTMTCDALHRRSLELQMGNGSATVGVEECIAPPG